jgi:hypothetical protein
VHTGVLAQEVHPRLQGKRCDQPGRVLGVVLLVRVDQRGHRVQDTQAAAQENQQRQGDAVSCPGFHPGPDPAHDRLLGVNLCFRKA